MIVCRRCGSTVTTTDTPGYSYYCPRHDEDLYEFETDEVEFLEIIVLSVYDDSYCMIEKLIKQGEFDKAVVELTKWDYGDDGICTDRFPAGLMDNVYHKNDYVMVYSTALGYVILYKKVNKK